MTTPTTKKRRPSIKGKWSDKNIVKALEWASQGWPDNKIAKAFGVTDSSYRRWKLLKPAFKEALAKGRATYKAEQEAAMVPKPPPPQPFRDYVIGRLSPEVAECYAMIKAIEDDDMPSLAKVEAFIAGNGKRFRQNLFIHILIDTNFKVSQAMSMAGVSKWEFDNWCREDEFGQLIDEVQWHKDNFFEEAFIRLVACGDTPATIHAVKSRLTGRGYGSKQAVEVAGTVEVKTTVDVDKLGLPLEQRLALLTAIQEQQAITVVEAEDDAG